MVEQCARWVWIGIFGLVGPFLAAQCPLGTLGTSPSELTCGTHTFSATGSTGTWNAIGLYSTSNWDLSAGPALSLNQPHGFAALLADGHAGAVPSIGGSAVRALGSTSAILGRAPVQSLGTVGLDSTLTATLPAVVPLTLYEFALNPGYNLGVRVQASDPTLRFGVYAGGGGSQWRARDASGDLQVGATAGLNLPAGTHVVAVFRSPQSVGAAVPLTISFSCGGAPVVLAPNQTSSYTTTCLPIALTPTPARWNVVALASSANWSLEMGGVSGSTFSTTDPAVLVADGRQGTPNALTGLARGPGNTASAVEARFAPATSTFGVVSSFWSIGAAPTTPIHVFEFQINTPGTYRVAGQWLYYSGGPVRAMVFAPGTNANWQDSTTAVANTQLLGTGWSSSATMTLGTGVHLLVLHTPGTPIATYGSFDVGIGQINNPVPVLAALSPARTLAGSGPLALSVSGSGFLPNSALTWNGTTIPSTVVGTSLITALVPAGLIDIPGPVSVQIANSTPGGGLSQPLNLEVAPPLVSTLFPAVLPVMSAGSPASVIQVNGFDFAPGCVVYGDGRALPTTRISANLVQCTLDPSVPGTRFPGAVALTVENFGFVPSNTLPLRFGTGINRGTIVRIPLDPDPGQAYAVRLEQGNPGSPLTLALSVGAPSIVEDWPSLAAPMVLSLNVGGLIPLLDGLGVFGTPDGAAFATSTLDLPGFIAPSPALGLDLTVQGAYVDPSSPLGFRLTWARYPDRL